MNRPIRCITSRPLHSACPEVTFSVARPVTVTLVNANTGDSPAGGQVTVKQLDMYGRNTKNLVSNSCSSRYLLILNTICNVLTYVFPVYCHMQICCSR